MTVNGVISGPSFILTARTNIFRILWFHFRSANPNPDVGSATAFFALNAVLSVNVKKGPNQKVTLPPTNSTQFSQESFGGGCVFGATFENVDIRGDDMGEFEGVQLFTAAQVGAQFSLAVNIDYTVTSFINVSGPNGMDYEVDMMVDISDYEQVARE